MTLLGTTIGRIRLIDFAGKGGMGEVFVGYDETLERKVAVKCVSPRYRLNKRVTGRILREARILSRLEHPHICQIYDVLQDDQGDFLVLELISGNSLGEAIKAGLEDKAKQRIAIQIADVLVATHAEGVIHRDLKPDNVMITEEGNVKVLDFGIARSPEPDEIVTVDPSNPPGSDVSRFTQGGTLIQDSATPATVKKGSNLAGTPRYMSPEQAKNEPNTPASDMYSLGLLLQELFTERSPLDQYPLPALMAEVSEGKSRPVEGLEKDLTHLIERLKSLSPSDRPTAKETADRLRWIKEAPKRRLQRGLAAAILFLMIGAVAKYTTDLQREQKAAIEARNQAVSARDQAEDLVAFMLEDLARELRPKGQLDALQKVAHAALDYYGQAALESAGDAAFLRGTAFRHAGDVLADQGEVESALQAFRSAEEIHRHLVAENPARSDWQVGLTQALLMLSDVLRASGQRRESEEVVEEALTIASRLVGQQPDDSATRSALGEALYIKGIHFLFEDNDVAEQAIKEAIGVYGALSEEYPEEKLYKFRLAVLHGQGLGQIYLAKGHQAEAFGEVQKAFGMFEDITSDQSFNGRWLHGFAWENRRMGHHFELQEKWEEALDSYRKALEITNRLLNFEPSHVDWQIGLSFDYSSLGDIYQRQRKSVEATQAYHQALDICEHLHRSDPANPEYIYCQATVHLDLAKITESLGKTEEARETWRRALEITSPTIQDLSLADDFVIEAHVYALIYLDLLDEARPLVAHLDKKGWIGNSVDDDFGRLVHELGLLP